MSKKNVLMISFVGTLLVFSQFFFGSHFCYARDSCYGVGEVINQDNLTLIYVLPFVFLFSLITYKLPEEVFQYWWRFARWFVPIIIIVTLLINSQTSSGGLGGAVSHAIDNILLGFFYIVFIYVSAVKIYVSTKKLK